MKNSKRSLNAAVLSALFISILAGCGSNNAIEVEALPEETVSDSTPIQYHESKIIGINPLIPVQVSGSNVDPGLRPKLNAFGIIQLGKNGICSGTHIGQGYVLTAGHCLIQSTPEKPVTQIKNTPCADTTVFWGYRGSEKTGNRTPLVTGKSSCSKVVLAILDGESDFAILKVNTPPKESIPLAKEATPTREKTKITIFGYPRGRALEWSQYCSIISSDKIGKNNPKGRFLHQCDTEPGNSGSSILSINSAGIIKVVGIHNAAIPNYDYNLGTYAFTLRSLARKNGITFLP
jgi:V8-like Glu-specific endopeptidase